ncbi:MAG: FecR family protein, partial [Deltaproteobacteria bacterium]|nr:FecR family protein [Deltaproteobacteria bacterium]
RGAVKVRRPTDAIWDAAERGMELFRAWRVNSRTRSSAEITFRDTSRLYMREDTIVVIYGPGAARAQVAAVEATLESGALESRLAAHDGARPTLRVHTPSALADLALGEALIAVDGGGVSVVANHGGQPAVVRGLDARQRPRGAAVAVAVGMGSKVRPGKLPEPPRKLPPAPAWVADAPDRFVSLGGAGATVAARWVAVPVAARYRVTVLADGDVDVTAVVAPATATGFELHGLPAGHYRARVATIDADDFEGIRSPDFAFEVIDAAVIPAGATEPLAAAPPPVADPEAGADLTAPVAAPLVAVGTHVRADGLTCDPIASTADTALRCRDAAGAALAPAPVQVVAVTVAAASATAATTIARDRITTVELALSSAAPLGPHFLAVASEGVTVVAVRPIAGGLAVDLQAGPTAGATGRLRVVASGEPPIEVAAVDLAIAAPAAATPSPRPDAPAPRSPVLELGGFAGVRTFAPGNALGAPASAATELAAGPLAGVRLGYFPTAAIGGEVELAAIAGRYAGIDGAAELASVRANLVVRRQGRHLGGRLLLGLGADALLASGRSASDNAMLVDLGAAGTFTTDSGLTLRLDLRDDISRSDAGERAHGLEATLGLLVPFR